MQNQINDLSSSELQTMTGSNPQKTQSDLSLGTKLLEIHHYTGED